MIDQPDPERVLNTVLIVDDHPLIARGLQWLFQDDAQNLQLHYVTSLEAARVDLEARERDSVLVVLDLNMPGYAGLEAFFALRTWWPTLHVAVWSGLEDRDLILRSLENHACGFIPKTTPPQQVASAIRLMLDGGIYIPHSVLLTNTTSEKTRDDVNASFSNGGSAFQGDFSAREGHLQALLEAMPPRRREVLSLLAQGASNKEICRKLDLSPNTVKTHVALIFSELHIHSRQSVSLMAHSNNLFRQFLSSEG
jgi:DNA-binding NarL/FixJ family response regulator